MIAKPRIFTRDGFWGVDVAGELIYPLPSVKVASILANHYMRRAYSKKDIEEFRKRNKLNFTVIRRARRDIEMQQRKLATLAGIDASQLSMFESGKYNLSNPELGRLADILVSHGCSWLKLYSWQSIPSGRVEQLD